HASSGAGRNHQLKCEAVSGDAGANPTPRKWRRHLVTFGARSEYPLRQCLLGSNEVLPKNVAPIEEMAGTDAIQGIE
ncbi:hypothetical protein PP728_22620, partial [Ralstonia solanacearum]|uniref:hypothetical protein n=1 Tax=Ralstonia solanacearum TaxID=305 RepID=UPI00202A2385